MDPQLMETICHSFGGCPQNNGNGGNGNGGGGGGGYNPWIWMFLAILIFFSYYMCKAMVKMLKTILFLVVCLLASLLSMTLVFYYLIPTGLRNRAPAILARNPPTRVVVVPNTNPPAIRDRRRRVAICAPPSSTITAPYYLRSMDKK